MTNPDHGVDLLLRRTADDLALPDVDRLVAGGVSRGRARRRRARIGTTVASVAVIGVVGAARPSCPSWAGRSRPPATRVRSSPPRPARPPGPRTWRRPPTCCGHWSDRTRWRLDAAGRSPVPSRLDWASIDRVGPTCQRVYYVIVDGAQVSFRFRWYNNPLVVEDGGPTAVAGLPVRARPDVDCTTLPDGSRLLRQEAYASGGAGVPDAVQERTATLATWDGWQVDVIATNTPAEKSGEVVAPEPVLTLDELTALATSDAWYALRCVRSARATRPAAAAPASRRGPGRAARGCARPARSRSSGRRRAACAAAARSAGAPGRSRGARS